MKFDDKAWAQHEKAIEKTFEEANAAAARHEDLDAATDAFCDVLKRAGMDVNRSDIRQQLRQDNG